MLGLSSVPRAGDSFISTDDDRTARQIAEKREARERAALQAQRRVRRTLEDFMASMEKGLPPTVIGCSSPSEVRPSAWRLKKMLKKARKRCQATPIVGVSEMVIIHANEMRILTVATT